MTGKFWDNFNNEVNWYIPGRKQNNQQTSKEMQA
jgi:hypothetical protein